MDRSEAIVFIPGLLCDEALWQAQVEHFTPRHPVSVAVCREGGSIAEMASLVLASAPRRFALCGISMGGYVSLEIMRQAPGRVSHLVLADTSPYPDSEAQIQRRSDLVALADRGRFQGVTNRLLPQLLAPASLTRPEITSVIIDMSRRLGREVYIRQQKAIMARQDSRPVLAGIDCPVCVLVGRQDRVTPVEIAQETAASIPGARLDIIEDAGHLPPIEQPNVFNLVLENFIKFV